jgi:hypothetical protein
MTLRLLFRLDNPIYYFFIYYFFLKGVPGFAGPGLDGPGLDVGLPVFFGGVVLPHPIGLTSF